MESQLLLEEREGCIDVVALRGNHEYERILAMTTLLRIRQYVPPSMGIRQRNFKSFVPVFLKPWVTPGGI